MANLFNRSRFLNVEKQSVLKNEVIKFCCERDSGFERWLKNKFLKWERELIQDADLDDLEDSVQIVITEAINQAIVNRNIDIINSLFDLVSQNQRGDEPHAQGDRDVDLKLLSLLNTLDSLGLVLQVTRRRGLDENA